MTIMNVGRDLSGNSLFAPKFSDSMQRTTLAVGVAQSFTVPTNAENFIAIFSYEPGSIVWVSNNGTATDSSSSVAGTVCSLNPSARKVSGGSAISMFTPDTSTRVGIEFYVQQ